MDAPMDADGNLLHVGDEVTKNLLLKPILKWVGGKRQLLADIAPLVPASPELYVEPFIGGAALLLDRQPAHALINDYNEELVNVYRTVRDDPEGLIELLRGHEEHNTGEYYYDIRGLDREPSFADLSNTARAARIIYLNKTCYNGLFRVNSQGQMNVPYGRYKHPNIVNAPGIKALSDYLKEHVDIRCGDYAATLVDLPKSAFVYLDPPYMPVSSTSAFTGYTEGGFGYAEQVRLRDECVKLRRQGASFLESNSDCEAVRELYDGFVIRVVRAKRSINSKGAGRGAVNEVLISGYPNAKVYGLSYIESGYGSLHPCHRPDDYELASASEMDYRTNTGLVSIRDVSGR